LAELYFESLEATTIPRDHPMNTMYAQNFWMHPEIDPLDLFNPKSPQYYSQRAGMVKFLAFRADLAAAGSRMDRSSGRHPQDQIRLD